MDQDSGEVPLCTVCTHHHHAGEKCPQCGHKGKAKTFKLLAEGPVSQGLHFEYFDSRSDENKYKGSWIFCQIIRRRVFCDESGILEHMEFDEFDAFSRQAVALVGDAPIGCARWRAEPTESGQYIALLDRLCLLPSHRGQGTCRAFLQSLIEDVRVTAPEIGIVCVAFMVSVPANSTIQQKLSENGFSTMGDIYDCRGQSHIRMFLNAS